MLRDHTQKTLIMLTTGYTVPGYIKMRAEAVFAFWWTDDFSRKTRAALGLKILRGHFLKKAPELMIVASLLGRIVDGKKVYSWQYKKLKGVLNERYRPR